MALEEGLKMCNELQLSHVQIESDSNVVVQAINHGSRVAWDLEYVYRECMSLLPTTGMIVHVYRQRNCVADRFADYAHTHRRKKEDFRVHDLPQSVRKEYQKDRLGGWKFRP